MGFEFSFEGLLRVRESFEKREEQKLAVAAGEFKRLDTVLAVVREQLISTDDRLSEILARGTTGADLHLLCLERLMLERRERVLAEGASSAFAEVQNQRTRLQEAQQKRKILDNLRQKQLAHFLLTQSRRDQQKLDDAFLPRRNHDDSGKGVA